MKVKEIQDLTTEELQKKLADSKVEPSTSVFSWPLANWITPCGYVM